MLRISSRRLALVLFFQTVLSQHAMILHFFRPNGAIFRSSWGGAEGSGYRIEETVSQPRFFVSLRMTDFGAFWFLYFAFNFFLLPFYLRLLAEAKSSASIIGATCVFDTKKYKTVDAVLAVSPCLIWNKKIFDFFYFCSQLQAVLVETMPSHSPRLLRKFRKQ